MPTSEPNAWAAILGILTALALAFTVTLKRLGFSISKGAKQVSIKTSTKTDGMVHISEESLSRFNKLDIRLKEDFTSKEIQKLVCENTLLTITGDFKDMLEASEKKILHAINGDLLRKSDLDDLSDKIINAVKE